MIIQSAVPREPLAVEVAPKRLTWQLGCAWDETEAPFCRMFSSVIDSMGSIHAFPQQGLVRDSLANSQPICAIVAA
jgi:hypothetical protein